MAHVVVRNLGGVDEDVIPCRLHKDGKPTLVIGVGVCDEDAEDGLISGSPDLFERVPGLGEEPPSVYDDDALVSLDPVQVHRVHLRGLVPVNSHCCTVPGRAGGFDPLVGGGFSLGIGGVRSLVGGQYERILEQLINYYFLP